MLCPACCARSLISCVPVQNIKADPALYFAAAKLEESHYKQEAVEAVRAAAGAAPGALPLSLCWLPCCWCLVADTCSCCLQPDSKFRVAGSLTEASKSSLLTSKPSGRRQPSDGAGPTNRVEHLDACE